MKAPKKAASLMKKQARAGYFFIFPLIIGVIGIFIPNLFKTFQFSFNDVIISGSKGYTLKGVGFKYYFDALMTDPNFIPMLLDDFKTMLINVPVVLIFSLFIANLLSQKFRGRAFARAIFFIPVLLATGILNEIEGYILVVMGGRSMQTGTTMDAAMNFGIDGMLRAINFSPVLIGIISSAVSNIYNVVKDSGLQIFIFLAGLQEIPTSLYEAAEVSGCSKWESFWKITFPMLGPQMAVNVIYTIIGSKSSLLFYASSTIGTVQNRYGLATAMAILYLVCLAAILSIVFVILAKFIRYSSE